MSEILTGLGPVFVFVAFMGVCWYAYGSSKRKAKFDEAANLPFADEELSKNSSKAQSEQTTQQKQD